MVGNISRKRSQEDKALRVIRDGIIAEGFSHAWGVGSDHRKRYGKSVSFLLPAEFRRRLHVDVRADFALDLTVLRFELPDVLTDQNQVSGVC